MKNAIAILFTMIGLSSIAQYKDVVHLKNGSVIRGRTVEQTAEQVKVRTKDGSIMVFSAGDIVTTDTYSLQISPSGYFIDATVGVLGGPGRGSFSAHLVQGFAFNRHWQAGFGLGFEAVAFNSYVPAFLEGKFNWLNKPNSPFVKVVGGYMVPVNFTQSDGGFSFGSSLGYSFYVANRLGLTTSLGYRFARLVEQNNWWWDDFETIRQLNRFELRIGLTFR